VATNWEDGKAAKRAAEAKAGSREPSALDGVSATLPATTRALKLQNRAARVGFDWTDARDILAKIKEEIGELEAEMKDAAPKRDAVEDELGDLFFAIVNLARRLELDPEAALRRTNRKFESRFRAMEAMLAAGGKHMKDMPLEELERLWVRAKENERQKTAG
jgi:ATP diphosphatase